MAVNSVKNKPNIHGKNSNLSSCPRSYKINYFLKYMHFGVNPVLVMALVAMVILSISRIMLIAWVYDQVPENGVIYILLQGIRIDFASICGLFALPLLVVSGLSLIPFVTFPRFILLLIRIYCAAAIAFLVMNEMATPGFINEYGVRPNHLYVQYLMYPKEVFATLWGGHKLELFLSLIVTFATFLGAYKLSNICFNHYVAGRFIYSFVVLLLTICVVPLGIRSTLGHRPLNPAMVSFTDNPLINSLPVNSSYNAVYALFHLNDADVGTNNFYKVASDYQVIVDGLEMSTRIAPIPHNKECPFNQQLLPFNSIFDGTWPRRSSTFEQSSFSSKNTSNKGDASSQQEQANAQASQELLFDENGERKLFNVVVILEESLGDNFVASQGGYPVTPNLEALGKEGWWFENLYAAGHRSVRGIEAVTAAFPPSAINSIVKLPQPKDEYATMFNIFREAGYATSFIYGGESHFDNMRSYFLNNGMDKVIEQKDYKNPTFLASWGVSDEDLFMKANEEFKTKYQNKEKFFSVIFSSSFHDPFDIPPGKVSLDGVKTKEPARLLAAKYADYALGEFFKQAKQEDYYKDTIFLVIADHESRVRGSGQFPLEDFTIPAVILGPNVKPYKDLRQVSQLDMSMTLMSLAGLEGSVPNVGQNLTRNDVKSRAIMQFNNIFGLLEKDKFIAIAPETTPYYYDVVDGEKLVLRKDMDNEMLQRAISLSNLGPVIYHDNYMSKSCINLKTSVKQEASATKDQ